MIIAGRISALIFLVLSFAVFYYYMYLAKQGKKITIRRLAAMEAIPEAIGRAAELGKPAVFATGIGYGGTLADTITGADILSGINLMGHAAKFAAEKGADFWVYTPIVDAIPLVEETLRNAYILGGRQEAFDPNHIRINPTQSSHLSAYLGFLQRDRPASCIIVGGILYEAVVMAEAGNAIGAMQISGTVNVFQIPFLVASTDYTLIMEEVYAASAMTHLDPDALGILYGEDIVKFIMLALIVLGVLLAFGRQTFLISLLGM